MDISGRTALVTGPPTEVRSLDDIRLEMETHNFGSLLLPRAFAPVLAAFESSAVLNVLSVLR